MLGMPNDSFRHLHADRHAPASVTSLADRRLLRPDPASASGTLAAELNGPVRLRVATIDDTCWGCRSNVRAVIGGLIDPAQTRDRSGFVPLEQIDDLLTAMLDQQDLKRRRIAPLRHRESPGIAGGYIANSCLECDALIGRFHVEDLVHEYRMTGSPLGRLDAGIVLHVDLSSVARRSAVSAAR